MEQVLYAISHKRMPWRELLGCKAATGGVNSVCTLCTEIAVVTHHVPGHPKDQHVASRQVSWSASDFSLRMQEFLEAIALVKLPSRKLMMTCCTVKPKIWARWVNKHQQVAIIHKFKALIFTVGLQGLINAGGASHWLESYCLAWISLPLLLKTTSHIHLDVVCFWVVFCG